MGWIKRNLFFVIGVVVALGLLGAAGYYDYAGWVNNKQAFTHLNEVYDKLKNNTVKDKNGHPLSPGSDKVDNIAAAKEQERQVRQWISQAREYFRPIAPIPKPTNGLVTSELFAGSLHRTVVQLQREAAAANVMLPPDYDFSFTAHMDRLMFVPGSLEPLAVQLGEVKTISEVLFATGVNALDGIQRVPASPDDASGPQTDYLADQPMTNDLAVLVPYQITFRGFSPEIAEVIKAFASSPNGFIVKGVSVQPASAAVTTTTGAAMPSNYDTGATPPPAPTPGKGGLQTVLDEQLLRVTMTIEVVKLAPRN